VKKKTDDWVSRQKGQILSFFKASIFTATA